MRFLLLLFLAVVVSVSSAQAQRWIYDSSRDTKAQAAAASAKESGSSALLESEIKNFNAYASEQTDLIEHWQSIKLRSQINAFDTWSKLQKYLEDTKQRIPTAEDIASEQAAIAQSAKAVQEAEQSIHDQIDAAAKKGGGDKKDKVEEILGDGSDLKEVDDLTKSIIKSQNPAAAKALDEAVAALQQVAKLYASVKDIMSAEKGVSKSLESMRPDPLTTQLKLYKAEADHWINLGLIAAREQLELGDAATALTLAQSYVGIISAPKDSDDIEQSLLDLAKKQDREHLVFALLALHYAASVAARQENAADIAELRTSLEDRRYNLERRAIVAGESEQTIQTAATRLSAYWKSGLKPKDVADLLFDLSGLVSLPVIAAK